jgi:23S rRNA A2030 N6-methylase RlmJ
MANRHFGKLADVWKHLALVEVLSIERPSRYWESHAGSATYDMVDDPERSYGVRTFLEVASRFPALARSRWLAHLSSMSDPAGQLTSYPGSPMLAALELGSGCSYLVCDLDPSSVTNLRAAAVQLGIASRVKVLDTDGMTALHQALLASEPDGPTTVAHIDPYDPRAVGPSGLSALDLARELIARRIGLVYWYGYDQPERRAWAFHELSESPHDPTIWCGDVMVAASDADLVDGDLGVATTPGTGFGVVCANLSINTIHACRQLGEELTAAYDDIPLPDGRPGHLEFTTQTSTPPDHP